MEVIRLFPPLTLFKRHSRKKSGMLQSKVPAYDFIYITRNISELHMETIWHRRRRYVNLQSCNLCLYAHKKKKKKQELGTRKQLSVSEEWWLPDMTRWDRFTLFSAKWVAFKWPCHRVGSLSHGIKAPYFTLDRDHSEDERFKLN